MDTEGTGVLHHWNYFLALEEDMLRLSRFVEFSEANFNCYSIELARILMMACAEIDVVAKRLCIRIDSSPIPEKPNVDYYRKVIVHEYARFAESSVKIDRHVLEMRPWESWKPGGDKNPDWWHAYTQVKHHRHTSYDRATLKNALNAVGALFVTVLYLFQEEAARGELRPDPTLYSVGDPIHVDRLMWGDGTLTYKMPTSSAVAE